MSRLNCVSIVPGIGMLRAALLLVAAFWSLPAAPEVAATSPARPDGRFTQGLLWRISKPGIAPSHVFGTIHVADPRVLDVPDPVDRALSLSRRFYMENVLGEREAARFYEAAQFEDGRRLEPLIGPEAYADVVSMLRERQIAEEVAARLKPWAALVNFTVTPQGYGRTTLDQKLLEVARARRLRILGLEGIEEQISVFDRIPLDTQVALLKHTLANRDYFIAMVEPAIQAWKKRDLGGIHAINDTIAARFPEMAGHYGILFKEVIDNRSIVMAHRLFMPLREGAAFIAIGANHLYGSRGILALIEEQGYEVDRMY